MNTRYFLALAPLLVTLGLSPAVSAQDVIDIDSGDEVGTAESSILKGAAALEAAEGQAALLRSRASINLQESVDEYLDNQVEVVKAYNARRKAWREAREEERRDPLSEKEYAELAAERGPDRLGSDRFDAYSGQILWPPILDAKELKPYRQAIEKAFKKRASAGANWSVQDYRVVKENADVMEKALRGVEERIDPKIFVGLLQMLESITWEAQHTASDERLEILG
ncbi:hypothetical protein [Roseimaritima sediminicola]|uniref:hypothetical protein n=1 Tax=Roseimaritima sediminicola TaxID=2662066 RepID=UPI00129833A4|nr:hypothetical protein [Roseimaritima sediminicola]